jgi:hypothetical protein
VPQGEIYTRDMAFLHVYQNGIYTVLRLLPAACTHGEIYTQGHGIPPCIYQNGIYTVASYYQQLVPLEKYTPRDMVPPYIRMGSSAHQLLPAACATRENIHPEYGIHVYIRMGSTQLRLLPATRKYT